MQQLAMTLMKVFLSKKLLVLLFKTLAKTSGNKIDDHIVLLIEGALNSDLEKMEKAAIELIEHTVPAVAQKIQQKS